MQKKKSKPTFSVPNAGFKKRVKHRWRKPRGIDSKKRAKFAYAGASPRIGYKNSPEVRGMHPTGKFEVLVHNVSELKAVSSLQSPVTDKSATVSRTSLKVQDPVSKLETGNGKQQFAARIASGVGRKKREEMKKIAAEMKIPLLN